MRWLVVSCVLGFLAACATAPPDREAGAPVRERADAGDPGTLRIETVGASAAPAIAGVTRKPNAPSPVARKVHHEGSIRLRATQPQRAIDQAVQWTRAAGGYVESLTPQNLVLQIPAERFRSVYGQVLGLGEVLAKSLSARDVTEEFLDVELRLAQAKAMRDRLLALIQRASSQSEKLRLLREVERLSKDIELMEARMARLRTLVEYSRLALSVEGRKALDGRAAQELRGFEWINSIGVNRRSPDRDASRFSLATPSGMVELADAPMWSAASPDGVMLQTQQRRNDPKGSTAFWLEALRLRLKDRFAQVEEKAAGDFAVLRAVSVEEPRFVFWIAVTTREDKLYVAQAYFPSEDRERRYETPVTTSLRGGVK
jgi:Domain of unknown function (DUF4349)